MMIKTMQTPRQQELPDMSRTDSRRPLVTRYSLLVTSFCGFVTVFGVAHLLLIDITKTSGYVFFGTLATVPLLIVAVLALLRSDRRAVLRRFGFGALMCLCAIPVIYLARFAPESTRATVRNLLGLPFFALALIGPGFITRARARNAGG